MEVFYSMLAMVAAGILSIFFYLFRHKIQDVLLGTDRDATIDELEQISQRNKFSSYLPWRAYDQEKVFYYNVDETVGFLWECTPLAFAGDKTTFILEGIFRIGIPYGSILQFILYADQYIEEELELYQKVKTRDNKILKESSKWYAEFFQKGTKEMDIFQRMPLRNYRLFVALKIPQKEAEQINITDVYSTVREILSGAGIHPQDLKPEELIDWMRKLFNDKPSGNNKRYNEEEYINKQVILSDTVIKKTLSDIKMGERYFRCTTVKTFPVEVDTFQTNECFGGVWGIISDSNQILTPFLYSLNVVYEDLKMKLHMKCNLVLQQQAAGSFAPSLMRKKEEYMRAVDDIEKGLPFVKIIPTLWVWSEDSQQAAESIVRAKRLWEQNGYVMQEDKGILPPLLVSSLPFGLYNVKDNIENLDRDFIAPASAVASLLPVQADFSGGGYPHLLFMGRKGQPCRLDLFGKAANNHNLFISASSGAGKSFLVNFITLNYYAADAMIRIIDIGGSYQKQTEVFKGRFLDFSPESNLCMNPFTNIREPESDLPPIISLLRTMVYSATDTIPFANAETEMTILKAATRWAWKTAGNDADIDTIYEFLNAYPKHTDEELKEKEDSGYKSAFKQVAVTLAYNIQDFTSTGTFGKWFCGRSNFDISADEFVVLELEHLKPIKELFKVITLQVINAVTQDLYLSDRSRRRLIIFDEAWQFLKEGRGALQEIIEEGYRRARKYGGSFSIITQSVMDIKQFGSVGDVIMANSAFKFYLESGDFEKAKEEKIIDLGDFGMQLLKSVKSNRPKYSEIFMDTPYGMGVTRLAVDPFSYYLFTSDAKEKAEIDSIVKTKGKDYAEAVKDMVRMYKS
jgi:conjugal transfer ATP-binding protein TraC